MMTDMFLQIDNSKAGKYAFALTGSGVTGYTILPTVSLRLPWAKSSLGLQPVVPDVPVLCALCPLGHLTSLSLSAAPHLSRFYSPFDCHI